MEITKLRIGNAIMSLGWDENSGGQIVGDPEGNEVVRVDIEILNSISKGNDITIYEPIPLNEEWIKKLGFQLDEDCRFEDLNVEIESVDELQNLYFFLMQEELSF